MTPFKGFLLWVGAATLNTYRNDFLDILNRQPTWYLVLFVLSNKTNTYSGCILYNVNFRCQNISVQRLPFGWMDPKKCLYYMLGQRVRLETISSKIGQVITYYSV